MNNIFQISSYYIFNTVSSQHSRHFQIHSLYCHIHSSCSHIHSSHSPFHPKGTSLLTRQREPCSISGPHCRPLCRDRDYLHTPKEEPCQHSQRTCRVHSGRGQGCP